MPGPQTPKKRLSTPSYQEALDWLYAQTRGGRPRALWRMQALLTTLALAPPPSSVHVVGTNGKGTVAAMIAAGLTLSGQRTGLFLSPHVERFSERVSVDGLEIEEEDVVDFSARLMRLQLGCQASFFELTLALALDHFARQRVAIAVVEAGVGARHDATLVLGDAAACVITNVARDHLDTIGPRLRDIALDKAEAIRPGKPVVTGARGKALEIVAEVARARGSPLFVASGGDALFRLPSGLPHGALGSGALRHNRRLAAAALRLLGMAETAVRGALEAPRLPARAEVFEVRARQVILDGAHNPSASRILSRTVPKPYVLLFAALPKKLGEQTLAQLEPAALATYVTRAARQPSSLSPRAERIFIEDPTEALNCALSACPAGATLVIAGSLYLAGELRPTLRALQRHGARQTAE